MQTLSVELDSSLSEEQMDFLKKSVILQAESELRKVLVVPKTEIDAIEVKIDVMRTANGIIKEVAPVVEPVVEPIVEPIAEPVVTPIK